MGAIVNGFDNLPADADPNRAALYARVYADLTALGLTLPAQTADTITRAQLVAHLRALAGQLVKDELTNDPEGRGYGPLTNAQVAAILHEEFAETTPQRLDGSHATGYRVVAPVDARIIMLERNPGGGAPGFDTFMVKNGNVVTAYLRFRNSATTVANRQVFRRVDVLQNGNGLVMTSPFPGVPAVGDICDLGHPNLRPIAGRLARVLRRFPYAPNALDAADVAGARS
jgi:hypothetical protein